MNTAKSTLLILTSPITKLSEEAVLAVFTLASFEHTVQIGLQEEALKLLTQPNHTLYKMLSSIDLYDIENLWLIIDEKTPRYRDLNPLEQSFSFQTKILNPMCEDLTKAKQHFDIVWAV